MTKVRYYHRVGGRTTEPASFEFGHEVGVIDERICFMITRRSDVSRSSTFSRGYCEVCMCLSRDFQSWTTLTANVRGGG